MATIAQYTMNSSEIPTYSDCSSLYSESLPFDSFSQDYLYHSAKESTNVSYTYKDSPANTTTTTGSIRSIDEWSSFDTTHSSGLGDLCIALTPTELSRTSPLPTRSRANPEHVPQTYSSPNTPTSPFVSPTLYLYSPLCSDKESQYPNKEQIRSPSRKRGRPRSDRTGNAPRNVAPNSHRICRTACLPHKEVERKYREGLNLEFERLRRVVPTLPQSVDAYIIGATKPTKVVVLAAAIDYIKRVERERDSALKEVERLRGNRGMSKVGETEG
jgi:hypothetical protein